MSRTAAVVLMLLTISFIAHAVKEQAMQGFRVSEDGHRFVLEDGTPFFWLGDTAWLLFTLSPADIEVYMADRAQRGFNVIQCMVIRTEPEEKSTLVPAHDGVLPFSSLAPLAFNEAYFSHIDTIVETAARHGLRVAMATLWGRDADGLFRDGEQDNYAYARFLGERYKDRPNVIWIASGEYEKINPGWVDQQYDIDTRQQRLLSRLGEGLRDGSDGRNLITIHPIFTSARHSHDAPWLDFNMQQTWGHLAPNTSRIAEDWARRPAKPVLNGEPGYENRPERNMGEMTPWHLRTEGYWSVFSGAAGFTYGAHHVWEFDEYWRESLAFEGGAQMQYLRRLIESRPMLSRIPLPKAILSDAGKAQDQSIIRATGSADGAYLMVYSTKGLSIEIDMELISGDRARAWWFSPRDGHVYDAQGHPTDVPFAVLPTRDRAAFTPPSSGEDQDWVLVLDDAARDMGTPGAI